MISKAVTGEDGEVEGRPGEIAEPTLAPAQELVGPLAFGDVANGDDPDGAVPDAPLLRAQRGPEARAVLANAGDRRTPPRSGPPSAA